MPGMQHKNVQNRENQIEQLVTSIENEEMIYMSIKKWIRYITVLAIIITMVLGIVGCKSSEEPVEEDSSKTETSQSSGETAGTLTLIKGDNKVTYTVAEIKAMPVSEGWGGIMNSSGVISGPFKQKGVELMYLLDKVGGIADGDALRVTAKDGYSMTYSYDQVANGNFTTLEFTTGNEIPHDKLTVIISYEEDGVTLTDQNGPLRVAILNADNQVTEGHWWIKWVTEIEIVPGEKTWSLRLEGYLDEDVDPGSFESCSAPGCHGATWTDDENRTWEGIPLWVLAGRIDDDNPHSKEAQAFNDAVADAGYDIEVIAADGYSKTFFITDIKRNDNYIVSFRRDGEPLPDNQWPLRLVGPDLTKGEMVGQITTIKVNLPSSPIEEPEWTLCLKGALNEDITPSYFAAAYEDCHAATWTDDDGREWQGIPLWLFVGRVDDDFKHNQNEPGAFNDALADSGYEVIVSAADGYSKTFTSQLVKRNDNMIIAFMRDGSPLPENQYPLRLVGPDLTKGEMVGQVACIEVVFP
jgi:DMSO/TMAO reductase YedYZ molybdopterin-dependent catalytic subunit